MADINIEMLKNKLYPVAKALFAISETLVDASKLSTPDGMPAKIPAKMIKDVPFPIPYSVICSPNHIINAVPAVNDNTIIKYVKKSCAYNTPLFPRLTAIPIP